MDGLNRKSFQGVSNIVRFNWHFYLMAVLAWIAISLIKDYFSETIQLLLNVGIFVSILVIVISLLVSYFVYDLSGLYQFRFLDQIPKTTDQNILNISAGFDETSSIIKAKFPAATLSICDFYDPVKHTEPSIKRARAMYPPSVDTIKVETNRLPFEDNQFDQSLVIFSAHEIRDSNERIMFFQELKRVTKQGGQIYVVEHLRDLHNFLAYNFGFFHFHSKKRWMDNFSKAGLEISEELKITPFISTFKLRSYGNSN